MRRLRPAQATLLVAVVGCVPLFEAEECFGPGDCRSAERCVDRRCLPDPDAATPPPDAGIDLGVDATPEPARLLGGLPGEGYASTVAVVGDVDGDGLADVAVGAPSATPPTCGDECGRVYVYRSAGSRLDPRPHAVLDGPPVPGARFGVDLVGGDFDGDGYADLAVATRAAAGVFVFRGSAEGIAGGRADRVADRHLPAPESVGDAILRVTSGDFDGDRVDDLAFSGSFWALGVPCGAQTHDIAGGVGRVEVHYGGTGGPGTGELGAQHVDLPAGDVDVCDCPQGCRFGEGVAAIDFDGDGLDDLAVVSGAAGRRGRVEVRLGRLRLGPAAAADHVVEGECTPDQIGLGATRRLGDVDGRPGEEIALLTRLPLPECVRERPAGQVVVAGLGGVLDAADAPADSGGSVAVGALAAWAPDGRTTLLLGAPDFSPTDAAGAAGRVWTLPVGADGRVAPAEVLFEGAPGQLLGAPLAVYRAHADAPARLLLGGFALGPDGAATNARALYERSLRP